MKLLTERAQLRDIALTWKQRYPPESYREDSKRAEILAKLSALDPETSTAEEVAAIIGNRVWVVQNRCNECGESGWERIQLGDEPDYNSDTVVMCENCLRAAVLLIERSRKFEWRPA